MLHRGVGRRLLFPIVLRDDGDDGFGPQSGVPEAGSGLLWARSASPDPFSSHPPGIAVVELVVWSRWWWW